MHCSQQPGISSPELASADTHPINARVLNGNGEEELEIRIYSDQNNEPVLRVYLHVQLGTGHG